jgi:putative DNA primase/helicase
MDQAQQIAESAVAYAVDPLAQPWNEPVALIAKIAPLPYPADSFPQVMRDAIKEIVDFTGAPPVLVASSAIAALSVAGQAYVDVKRAEHLQGPTSLFLLTVAESGERKSTCDSSFMAPLHDYDRRMAIQMKPAQEKYESELAIWTAAHEGMLADIKKLAKDGADTTERADALKKHDLSKPLRPKVPRLMLGDETPESLAWTLSQDWPTAGVMSSEAGLILGSHGMKTDSMMRNLAQYNLLWDGAPMSTGRRTSQSFKVEAARFTMSLQIQEASLRTFFEQTKGLARGTGFLARFLFANPQSTQGTRMFKEAGPRIALDSFAKRLNEILAVPLPFDSNWRLVPLVLPMREDAKAMWVEFFNSVEIQLNSGGQLADVRDVASKTADNAARLAGLFHLYCYGMHGEIDAECMTMAIAVAGWHLAEARRFLGEMSLPLEVADAIRLDEWIIQYCISYNVDHVSKQLIQQRGPNSVRPKKRLSAALDELVSMERMRLVKTGRKNDIYVNPALLIQHDTCAVH